MKEVFCIAAVSLEKTGEWFIAKDSGHFVDWVSNKDKEFFRKMVKEAGVAVMGRNTYNTFHKKFGAGLAYTRNIVYSYSSGATVPGAEITQESPTDLVARLDADPSIHAIAVIGGADIYTQFMRAGVVDTFYVSVHTNTQFGAGIPLFKVGSNIQLPEPITKEWLDPDHKTAQLLTYDIAAHKKALIK